MAAVFTFRRLCFLLQLLMIWLSTTTPAPALSERCNPEDKKALLQIKKDLGNPSFLSRWDPSTDCCDNTWDGVKCDTQTNRVVTLSLSRIELEIPYLELPRPTHIPSSVLNLPHLILLYLDHMPNLTGPIPPEISKLNKLNFFYISHTRVYGPIPDSVAQLKALKELDFSFNKLSGPIPPSLARLPNLQLITFDNNGLTGPIPPFGSFSNVFESISVSRNQLSGQIPASLGRLDMVLVDLSRNKLEGDASVLFGPNKTGYQINLSRNKFAFDLGKVELPQTLTHLDLSNNQIYGKLPEGLTKLKKLVKFNVSYNNLCGEIPQGGNLKRFGVDSYIHNKCLCGSPLPSCK